MNRTGSLSLQTSTEQLLENLQSEVNPNKIKSTSVTKEIQTFTGC